MSDTPKKKRVSWSNEHRSKMSELAELRKADATSPDHILKPYENYDTHKNQWAAASEHERKALVYGLVMFDGFTRMTDIARLFCVKAAEIEKFSDLFYSARMALKGKVQRNMINLGLSRDDSVPLKFHMALQYAEQVVNPAHDGVEATPDDRTVVIEVIAPPERKQAKKTAADDSVAGITEGVPRIAVGDKQHLQ